jgi:hypothetical protein
MIKNLIRKMVGEAMAEQSNKPDLSIQLAALKAENAELKAKLENSTASKSLAKLKQMAAGIPDGAQGGGMIAVIENGVVKNLTLSSKADLTAVIARAEANELEILGS